MRISIPPLVPPYGLLVLVIAYAFGSLWFGLGRLDDIAGFAISTTTSSATLEDLQALRDVVGDIEAAGPVVAATADVHAASLERGRGRVPTLLAALRDRMRDDSTELALLEELVPMIAERMTLSASNMERPPGATGPGNDHAVARTAKSVSGQIHAIIASLKARELHELEQLRAARNRAVSEARRDLYMMTAVTLLVACALFLALRRLRSFLVVMPANQDKSVAVTASDASTMARDAGVGTLLHDALLRLRFVATEAPADTETGGHRRSLRAAVEQALEAHAAAYDDDPLQPARNGLAEAMANLARAYSRAGGLAVEAQLDQRVRTQDAQMAFVIFRSAEWALEAIAVRKRAGHVALELSESEDRFFLRVYALVDDPRLPVALTRKESEEADALRQAATAVGGSFVLGEGPTGFSLMLTLPTGP